MLSLIKHFFFACCLFGSETGCSESNWCNEGVDRWDKMAERGKDKPGKTTQHFSSASHRLAVQKFDAFQMKNMHVDVSYERSKTERLFTYF